MGVALEAIAKKFGYRLKNMDKPVLYTSSCVICRLLALFVMDSSSSNFASLQVKDKVNLCFFDKYFLFPTMVACCVVILSLFFMHPFPGYVDLSVIVCSGHHIRACRYILDLYPCKGPLYVLINKARLAMGKNPNPVI
jgi:hypothetical protein